MIDVVSQCIVEVRRCRKHLAKGGSPRFWHRRIGNALKELEQATREMYTMMDELETRCGYRCSECGEVAVSIEGNLCTCANCHCWAVGHPVAKAGGADGG